MKMNLACGKRYAEGYVNVDLDAPKVDLLADLGSRASRARALEPYAGKCEEVLCIHFLEHLLPWEALPFLIDCRALLAPGGLLVLELPDLLKCCQNILNGERDQLGMWGLYGDPGHLNPYMLHRWAYTPKALASMLRQAGFDAGRITQTVPQWHKSGRYNRDMRLEARR